MMLESLLLLHAQQALCNPGQKVLVMTCRRSRWREDCAWFVGQEECWAVEYHHPVCAWSGWDLQHPGIILGAIGGLFAERAHCTPEGRAEPARE